MIKPKQKLSREEILNTKFKTEMLGYSVEEVDKMLDEVLEDYRIFEETIGDLISDGNEKSKIISDKEEEIEKLQLELMNLKEIQNKKNKEF